MANCYSSGSTTRTSFIREVTFGVTPSTPEMQVIPVEKNDITLTQDNLSSNAVSGDRMRRFTRRGNQTVGGAIDVELAHETFDQLLEGLLNDRFADDTATSIKVANTPSSFTIERGDASKNIFETFTGCVVDSASFEISLGSLVKTSFSFIGKDGAKSTTALDADPIDAPDKQPMYQADCAVEINGSKVDYVSAMTLEIANNATPNNSIGFDAASCVSTNDVMVSGTVTFYLKDLIAAQRFDNETRTTLTLRLDDGKSNTVTLHMPEVDWQSANMAQSGKDTRTLTMDFEAVYDAALDSVLSLTRSVTA